MDSMEKKSLVFQNDKSDKFYNISLNGDGVVGDDGKYTINFHGNIITGKVVGDDGKYTVDIHFGRNGTDGQRSSKTKEPVPYDEAKKIYDKAVASKLKKGYQEV